MLGACRVGSGGNGLQAVPPAFLCRLQQFLEAAHRSKSVILPAARTFTPHDFAVGVQAPRIAFVPGWELLVLDAAVSVNQFAGFVDTD